MVKIVYNGCYGKFSLSHAAVLRYAEIKGVRLWPEKSKYGQIKYWTVPEEKRPDPTMEVWTKLSQEERKAINEARAAARLYSHNIPRDDPALAQVVEELQEAANGPHAALRVAEIASGERYRIEVYDGFERIDTPDTYEWKIA